MILIYQRPHINILYLIIKSEWTCDYVGCLEFYPSIRMEFLVSASIGDYFSQQ